MYAVHEHGLWEGSVHGWSERLSRPKGDLRSVCVWNGEVWISSASEGLCHLQGDALVSVKDNQRPRRMESRGELLLVHDDKVTTSADGARYGAWKLDKLEALFASCRRPHWV